MASLAEIETTDWLAAAWLPPDHVLAPGVCAADVVGFHQRAATPPGAEFRRGIIYGTAGEGGRDLSLYLYSRTDCTERRPVVIFIHGGGWRAGHPFMLLRFAHHFAARGYVTATVTYRRFPEGRWPAPLEDVKCAVRWMRRYATSLGADPGQIGAVGNSAGGQLAAMLALTPGQFEGAGGHAAVSSCVQAAALLYPITDMHVPGTCDPDVPDFAAGIRELFADSSEEALQAASPITRVTPDAPPLLTLAGAEDKLCPLPMIRDFHSALDRVGARNTLQAVANAGHAFDFLPAGWATAAAALEDFFGQHLTGRRQEQA